MAEQRKAAAAGDHNTVTHEPVAPAPETATVTDAAKRTSKDKRVTLRVAHPHALFDLSGAGLADVTQAGTTYTEAEADEVRTLAMKYGVPVFEVARDDEENAK